MKTIFTISLLILSFIGYSQTSTTTYYRNGKEVAPEKANRSETVTRYNDGKVTTEIKDLKNNKITYRATNKGEEPYGIWLESDGKEMNYDFELVYTDTGCHDLPDPKIKDSFRDDDTIGYLAPKLKSGEDFYRHLWHNLEYPRFAKENGIQGRVVLVFILDQEGKIQRLAVSEKSKHVSIDKEAMRVIREMEFATPPKLNGVSQHFCFTLPISFKLE